MELSKNLGLVLFDEPDKFQITGDKNSLNHNFEILEDAFADVDVKIEECKDSVKDVEKMIETQDDAIDGVKKYVNDVVSDLRNDVADIAKDAKDEIEVALTDVKNEIQEAKDNISGFVETKVVEAQAAINEAVEKAVEDTKESVDTKQDKLIAGKNIVIENNVISAVFDQSEISYNVKDYITEEKNLADAIDEIVETVEGEKAIIEIPDGEYVVDKPIVPSGDVVIKGANDSVIKSDNEVVLDMSNCTSAEIDGVKFESETEGAKVIMPENGSINDSEFVGVSVEAEKNAEINDCSFFDCDTAITLEGEEAVINDCKFENVNNGIVIKTNHNIISDVKFVNVHNTAIKMSDESNDNIITSFIVSGCDNAAIEVHGNGNMIVGHICEAGKSYVGKTVETIDMEQEGHKSCAIYMNDNNENVTGNNKINVIIARKNGVPLTDLYMSGGSYNDNNIEITTNFDHSINAPHFEPLKYVAGGKENDKTRAFFRGIIRINGSEYYMPERAAYPFDANYIFLNNYLIGNTRAAGGKGWQPPVRAGLFMNYSWDDDYYMSVYNQDEEKYEWMLINPIQIDTTLTVSGKAADARATGKNDSKIQSQIASLLNRIVALENKHVETK